MWPQNPQKKVKSILNKIKAGQASEMDIASLGASLDEQPSVVAETVTFLTGLIQKEDAKACSMAIQALNVAADKDLGKVADSLDMIVGFIDTAGRKFHEDWILSSLEILFKICQKYPEKMSIAISELFVCLGNSSPKVREKAYFPLAILVVTQPGFFRGRSKELIRALSGLTVDERIYACRIIKKIAEKDSGIVEDVSCILEDLRFNSPDGNLRSEAAYAVEKLKIIETA